MSDNSIIDFHFRSRSDYVLTMNRSVPFKVVLLGEGSVGKVSTRETIQRSNSSSCLDIHRPTVHGKLVQ